MKKVYLKGVNVVVEGVSIETIYIPVRTARFQPRSGQIVITDFETRTDYRIDLDILRGDEDQSFATMDLAVDYLSEFIGSFKKEGSGGGTPSGRIFDFTAQNYNALIQTDGTEIGQLALVYDSQGNKWLPGTLGGTYYPQGTYVWTGTSWISNRNEIASAFRRLDTGWTFHTDSEFTESNPFVVPQGQTLKLPNNNSFSIVSQLPEGYAPFYDGNLLKSTNELDSINVSVRFKVKSSINQGGLAYFIDIGGTQGRIIGDSRRLLRTAGVENTINYESSPFTGATFNSVGGEILIEAVAGSLSIYDIAYKITLQHQGK